MTGEIPLADHSVLAVPDHVLSRKAAGEIVLLCLQTEEYYGLDGVGSRLWHLLEGGVSFGQALETLLEEYDVERAVLDGDLRALLAEMVAHRLVLVDAA